MVLSGRQTSSESTIQDEIASFSLEWSPRSNKNQEDEGIEPFMLLCGSINWSVILLLKYYFDRRLNLHSHVQRRKAPMLSTLLVSERSVWISPSSDPGRYCAPLIKVSIFSFEDQLSCCMIRQHDGLNDCLYRFQPRLLAGRCSSSQASWGGCTKSLLGRVHKRES